jgi:hypothetical protein
LWGLHNEHRVPLPKLVAATLFDWFDDVRAPMVLNALLLAALAAGMIWIARRIRGSTSITDVVFPLLWLSTGNAENLLMAFQLALVLPTVLAGVMLLVVVRRARTEFSAPEALVLVASLALLPLCGGPGITQWPAWTLALVFFLVKARATVAARVVLGAGVTVAAAVVALYLIGYERPHTETPAGDVVRALGTGWRVVAMSFGFAGSAWWPWSGLACAVMALIACVVSFRAWRERPEERLRIAAILCAIGAVATLALAIGWARGGAGSEVGFAARYITLPAPWIAATVFACLLFGEPRTQKLVPGVLALALLGAELTQNMAWGRSYAGGYRQLEQSFAADVTGPLPAQRTIANWTGRAYSHRVRLYQLLELMARARVAPFDTASEATISRYSKSIFDVPPDALQSPVPPLRRYLDDLCDVLAVPTDSRIFLVVPDGADSFSGFFGVPPIWIQRGQTLGIRAIVRAEDKGTILFDRTIDPVRVASHRGPQRFDVTFAVGSTQRVVLEITWPEGAPHVADWGFWADPYFE